MEGVIFIFIAAVLLSKLLSNTKSIGQIKCNRCGHVGPAGKKFVPFQGQVPICKKCKGQDWNKVA